MGEIIQFPGRERRSQERDTTTDVLSSAVDADVINIGDINTYKVSPEDIDHFQEVGRGVNVYLKSRIYKYLSGNTLYQSSLNPNQALLLKTAIDETQRDINPRRSGMSSRRFAAFRSVTKDRSEALFLEMLMTQTERIHTRFHHQAEPTTQAGQEYFSEKDEWGELAVRVESLLMKRDGINKRHTEGAFREVIAVTSNKYQATTRGIRFGVYRALEELKERGINTQGPRQSRKLFKAARLAMAIDFIEAVDSGARAEEVAPFLARTLHYEEIKDLSLYEHDMGIAVSPDDGPLVS